MLNIYQFNPKDYPDDHPFWEKYYRFVIQSSKERSPDEPVSSLEYIIKRQKQQAEFTDFEVRKFLLEEKYHINIYNH